MLLDLEGLLRILQSTKLALPIFIRAGTHSGTIRTAIAKLDSEVLDVEPYVLRPNENVVCIAVAYIGTADKKTVVWMSPVCMAV